MEFFDLIAEFGGLFGFEFLGGFAHVGFQFRDGVVQVGLVDLFDDDDGLGELVSVNWVAELIAASTFPCRASWKRALACWRQVRFGHRHRGERWPTQYLSTSLTPNRSALSV